MSSAANQYRSERAASQGIGKVFSEHREGLQWLAKFLTGNDKVADACVIDACALAESKNPSLENRLVKWGRLATIHSAVQVQRSRIVQLSPVYTRLPCIHERHSTLVQESIELVVETSSLLIARLDVLCRCALVLCGIEKYSTREAALLLDIDYTTIESAYCAALEFLDVLGCEQFRQENEFAAVCN
jgi:DNA-directed RNA polymerase specialized sigma24 family protein